MIGRRLAGGRALLHPHVSCPTPCSTLSFLGASREPLCLAGPVRISRERGRQEYIRQFCTSSWRLLRTSATTTSTRTRTPAGLLLVDYDMPVQQVLTKILVLRVQTKHGATTDPLRVRKDAFSARTAQDPSCLAIYGYSSRAPGHN